MKAQIAILDYGMGNLHSAAKACEQVAPNYDVRITQDPLMIAQADKVIFPGVGAIAACMQGLDDHQLQDALLHALAEKPVLAICIGMQALMQFSSENNGVKGLGFFPGQIGQLPSGPDIKIPHMGWNQVEHSRSHPLWHQIPNNSYFYFVHSYAHQPNSSDVSHIIGTTTHSAKFTSALAKDQVCAVQFHPEKSQQIGLQLLNNFIHLI